MDETDDEDLTSWSARVRKIHRDFLQETGLWHEYVPGVLLEFFRCCFSPDGDALARSMMFWR
jgi:hypothetical protein